MKTKTSPKSSPGPRPVTPEPEESTATPETIKAKISIPINDDGSIDVGSMRDKSKEKLRKALASTPEFSSPGPGADGPAVPMFPPMVVVSLYRSITLIEVLLAQRLAGIPPEIGKEAFTYSEKELEQLIPPTSRILAKYAKDWMIKYADEITLATLLTTMTISKVNAAIILMRISQAKKVETAEKEPVEPTVPIQ